jgi:predicted CoA-binding protein
MKTIAVVGASADRRKFGNKCVRAYHEAGYEVFPVHPSEREIEGLPAYANLSEVPAAPLDVISVYLAPPVTLAVLPEIAGAAARRVWFNPGSADGAVLAEARRLGIAARPGCSIVDIGRSPSEFPA